MGWRDVRGEEIAQIDAMKTVRRVRRTLWASLCGRSNVGIVHLLTLNLTPK